MYIFGGIHHTQKCIGAENSDKCEENSRYECDGYSGVYRSLNAIVVVSAECMSNSDAGADGKT